MAKLCSDQDLDFSEGPFIVARSGTSDTFRIEVESSLYKRGAILPHISIYQVYNLRKLPLKEQMRVCDRLNADVRAGHIVYLDGWWQFDLFDHINNLVSRGLQLPTRANLDLVTNKLTAALSIW